MSKSKRKIKKQTSSFEVDQSVRIEELNRDTIIGIGSKDKQYSYRLSRRNKRFFNEYFRLIGKPRRCAPLVFAAAVILALRKSGQKITRVTIDSEYVGYESLVQTAVSAAYPSAVITLGRIGRLSPAHQAAYGTHLGKKQPNGVLVRKQLEKIVTELRKQNDGRRAASPGINRDSQTHNRPVKRKHTRRR